MINRRKFTTGVATVGAAVIAGCAEEETTTETPDDAENESEPDTETSDDAENESEPEKKEESDEIAIQSIDVTNSVELGSFFDVIVTVVVESEATVTGELLDNNAELEDEETIELSDTGEQSVEFSLIPGSLAATGEGSLRVVVETESTTREDSVTLELVTPPEDWERPFKNTQESVNRFFDAYAAVGSESEDRTILDTQITDGYDGQGKSDLRDADDSAWDAFSETDVGQNPDASERMRRLRNETDFLLQLADTQRELCDIWSLIEQELENFREDRDMNEDVDVQFSTVQSMYDDLSEEFEELDPVIGAEYEEKLEQIEAELDAVDLMINAFTAVFSARDYFDQEFFGTAFDRAQSARRDFDNVIRDMDRASHYPPEGETNDVFVEHVKEWKDEAD